MRYENVLAIYLATPAAMSKWRALPEHERLERRTAGVRAWRMWMEKNKASIVETGSPLGRTRNISREGTTDVSNSMIAYTVVRAESHEAVARLFGSHPHFTILPGESIEVMECPPMLGD